MDTFITTNGITMIHLGDYCLELLKENDGSDVYRITLGDNFSDEMLTLLYSKGTLSIRKFNTTYEGGDIFFMEMSIEQVPEILSYFIKGHKLKLLPIYHKSTVRKQNNK